MSADPLADLRPTLDFVDAELHRSMRADDAWLATVIAIYMLAAGIAAFLVIEASL